MNVQVESPLATIARKKTFMTCDELADLLCCDKSLIYKQVKSGRLPAIKIASMIRLDPSVVAAWLQDRTTI